MNIASISNVQHTTTNSRMTNSTKSKSNIAFGEKDAFVSPEEELKFWQEAQNRVAKMLSNYANHETSLKEAERASMILAGRAAEEGYSHTAASHHKKADEFKARLKQHEAESHIEVPKLRESYERYEKLISELKQKIKAEKVAKAMRRAEEFLNKNLFGKALKSLKLGGLVTRLAKRV